MESLRIAVFFEAAFLFALRCIETGGRQVTNESLLIDLFVQSEKFTIPAGMNRVSRIRTLNPGSIRIFYQADVSTLTRIVPVGSMNLFGCLTTAHAIASGVSDWIF